MNYTDCQDFLGSRLFAQIRVIWPMMRIDFDHFRYALWHLRLHSQVLATSTGYSEPPDTKKSPAKPSIKHRLLKV